MYHLFYAALTRYITRLFIPHTAIIIEQDWIKFLFLGNYHNFENVCCQGQDFKLCCYSHIKWSHHLNLFISLYVEVERIALLRNNRSVTYLFFSWYYYYVGEVFYIYIYIYIYISFLSKRPKINIVTSCIIEHSSEKIAAQVSCPQLQ